MLSTTWNDYWVCVEGFFVYPEANTPPKNTDKLPGRTKQRWDFQEQLLTAPNTLEIAYVTEGLECLGRHVSANHVTAVLKITSHKGQFFSAEGYSCN